MQFSFVDSLLADLYTDARPFSHVLLGKDDIIFSQVSTVLFHLISIPSMRGMLVVVNQQ